MANDLKLIAHEVLIIVMAFCDASREAAQLLTKQAYTHSVAVIFGFAEEPRSEYPPEIHGGSAGVVIFDEKPCAVTCKHVVRGFVEAQNREPRYKFQIGNLSFDPLEHILDSDDEIDLAVLDLTGLDLKRLNDRLDHPVQPLNPTRWPNPIVSQDDFAIVCGYPEVTRAFDVPQRLVMSPAFPIVERVSTVDVDGFVLMFDRSKWVNTADDSPAPDWVRELNLGGLSGAPVFSVRNPCGQVGVLEFVGTVLSEIPFVDGLRARSSARIAPDGMIVR